MSVSWLKVSCVALGSAIALSAISAVAAPTTHTSPAQVRLAAISPVIVPPPPPGSQSFLNSPVIVPPPPPGTQSFLNSPVIVPPMPPGKQNG